MVVVPSVRFCLSPQRSQEKEGNPMKLTELIAKPEDMELFAALLSALLATVEDDR